MSLVFLYVLCGLVFLLGLAYYLTCEFMRYLKQADETLTEQELILVLMIYTATALLWSLIWPVSVVMFAIYLRALSKATNSPGRDGYAPEPDDHFYS